MNIKATKKQGGGTMKNPFIRLFYCESGERVYVTINVNSIVCYEYEPWNAATAVHLTNGDTLRVSNFPSNIASKIAAAKGRRHA